MPTDYVQVGRTRQKQRTRQALLDAAAELIQSGETPRVEEAADAAGVSRTTAYRYFASQAELLEAAFPETAVSSLLPSPPPVDVQDRVLAVATAMAERGEQTEPQLRAMLRLSLGETPHELPLRQGRAIGWYLEALEPVRDQLGEAGLRNVAIALRSVSGIETRVWLRDVAGLDSASIRAMQVWLTQAVVARALAAPPPLVTEGSPRRRRS